MSEWTRRNSREEGDVTRLTSHVSRDLSSQQRTVFRPLTHQLRSPRSIDILAAATPSRAWIATPKRQNVCRNRSVSVEMTPILDQSPL